MGIEVICDVSGSMTSVEIVTFDESGYKVLCWIFFFIIVVALYTVAKHHVSTYVLGFFLLTPMSSILTLSRGNDNFLVLYTTVSLSP